MNFLGNLFSLSRKATTISSLNNPANDHSFPSVSPPLRLVTSSFVVENTGCRSFEQEKSFQIIVSPNGEEIYFFNVIDFIENHPDMFVVDVAQIIDMAKTQTAQVSIGFEDFAYRLDIFERTKQFYKQLGITKEDIDEKYTKFVEIAGRGKYAKLDIGLSQID
ncbi:hypothetical protein OCU04_004190 [Sclerotinia nivalis]|uniref:Uncharacterized protein n=1 Tax=Sclerotinia nivalis TaxID=352851 RepID=A0A9X0AQX0_9HELO|nr:hypothetical protein OCU04_004190 [Sclerotinia nivalis]